MDIKPDWRPTIRAPINFESRGNQPARIEGYASVYYDGTKNTEYQPWDGVVERIIPGAFNDHLTSGADVLALYNHDLNQVLGRRAAKTLTLKSDKTGLFYSVDMADTQLSRDLWESIKRGDIPGSSFSFRVTDEDWRMEKGIDIREIKGVELFDVGPVASPAYSGTTTEANSQRSVINIDEARASYNKWKSRGQPISIRSPQAKLLRWVEIQKNEKVDRKKPKLFANLK